MSIVQILCLGLVGTAIVRAQSYGALRLARQSSSSTTYSSGRLEIYINGQWGTVCDDLWDSSDSNVACRQLGYSGGISPYYATSSNVVGFGSGTGRIWLDNVGCSGSESRLTSCTNNGIGVHNCGHSEDVAIYCSSGTSTSQLSGDLRLVRNGLTSSSYTSGRLEVYYSGQWGTVCDDGWDSSNTRVACRQLGLSTFTTSWTTSSSGGFGSASGTIWLDNVNCFGTESRLTSCSRNSYGSHDCSHSEDVAIYCGTSSVSIIVGTTFGVLGLVTVLWCIAFCICMKVSTCPLHNIYYKRTIQNLAEAPPVQANLGAEMGGVTTLYPPPSQTQQTTF